MNEIDNLLSRGVADVIVKKDLENKLKSGKALNIKFGIDPTGDSLHIGHAVILRKLRDFQRLGHKIIFISGSFTARIGDPTGKSETRKTLSAKDIKKNMENYKKEAGKILDLEKTSFYENHEWLEFMSFAEIIEVSQNFTVSQMMERDMFEERAKKGLPISMHEFFYPIMQGYDSVVVRADLELGATEQTFNLLAGRTIQKHFGEKPQDIMTMPILEGTDGKEKMSKSLGNFIGLSEPPKEMFGKTMSIPDSLIIKYFELCTDLPTKEVDEINEALKRGNNPRDAKVRLAREIVGLYHNQRKAIEAEKEFIEMFQKKGLPDEVPEFKFKGKKNIVDIISEKELTSSKSEARRMIKQNAVSLDNEKISDPNLEISCNNQILKVGKRKFLKLKK